MNETNIDLFTLKLMTLQLLSWIDDFNAAFTLSSFGFEPNL